MYSSTRWTLPPLVSPMHIEGMPRLIGIFASVLDASQTAPMPSAARTSTPIGTSPASSGQGPGRPVTDDSVDTAMPLVATAAIRASTVADEVRQGRRADRAHVDHGDGFRGDRVDADPAVEQADVEAGLRIACEGNLVQAGHQTGQRVDRARPARVTPAMAARAR